MVLGLLAEENDCLSLTTGPLTYHRHFCVTAKLFAVELGIGLLSVTVLLVNFEYEEFIL